jgi:hypothetical protein
MQSRVDASRYLGQAQEQIETKFSNERRGTLKGHDFSRAMNAVNFIGL